MVDRWGSGERGRSASGERFRSSEKENWRRDNERRNVLPSKSDVAADSCLAVMMEQGCYGDSIQNKPALDTQFSVHDIDNGSIGASQDLRDGPLNQQSIKLKGSSEVFEKKSTQASNFTLNGISANEIATTLQRLSDELKASAEVIGMLGH